MPLLTKRIITVAIFAVAMGFLESAVVIYLREVLYPNGFRFPLAPIPHRLALVEVLREAATVIMLVGTGYLAGRTAIQRFAFFTFAFALWDLCYYLFLYIFLGWPESLFTWDILFLIPLPWVGPVWAPCLLCVLMIFGSLHIIRQKEANPLYQIRKFEWLILLTGAIVCIISFMLDYLRSTTSLFQDSVISGGDIFTGISAYVPHTFDSAVFFCGFTMMLFTVISNILITNKIKKK